ncbi:hypothetical protein [Dyadobacter sp. CY323]|uniref:hypothetical protein n=1 Tax=Dyadobacter sp. CY323 TaxID=2907302 RepID=UPI001F27D1D9|nr:hypothetical protein [Dyadobacter sp. CY323]MCE6988867.1 hypothetical protein [Dyadobacter sp. CY323]
MKTIEKQFAQIRHSKWMLNPVIAGLLFIALISSCKKEEDKFNFVSYNGEYPRNMDGSQITTSIPDVVGGVLNVTFNGHTWNHYPHMLIAAEDFNSLDTANKVKEVQLVINAFSENMNLSTCLKEFFFIRVPLKGTTVLNAYLTGSRSESATINFSTMDCANPKDRFKLDRSKLSFVNVESYDTLTREVQLGFDISFMMMDRNTHLGPVYPKNVNLTGRVKAVLRK